MTGSWRALPGSARLSSTGPSTGERPRLRTGVTAYGSSRDCASAETAWGRARAGKAMPGKDMACCWASEKNRVICRSQICCASTMASATSNIGIIDAQIQSRQNPFRLAIAPTQPAQRPLLSTSRGGIHCHQHLAILCDEGTRAAVLLFGSPAPTIRPAPTRGSRLAPFLPPNTALICPPAYADLFAMSAGRRASLSSGRDGLHSRYRLNLDVKPRNRSNEIPDDDEQRVSALAWACCQPQGLTPRRAAYCGR